jgi:hypothetical protein
LAPGVSNDEEDDDPVTYDPAEHPEWGHTAWYRSRTVVIVPAISKPGCILEILDLGANEPFIVSRELFFNDPAGTLVLTGDEQYEELMNFTHKQNLGNGRMEFDSTILVADSLETAELRNECLRGNFWVTAIELQPDELLAMVGRVGTLFDRRRVRVSSECKHFLRQHREVRYEVQKNLKTGVETVTEDGRHPAVEAFRLFASSLNMWSLQ